MADPDGALAGRDAATPAPPSTPHGDVGAEDRPLPDVTAKPPRFPEVPGDGGDVGDVGQGDVTPAGPRRDGLALRLEDCYPARREDEVRALRRQRDQHYQLDLLRQIEEKRRERLQRRREDIRNDLLRLGRQDRNDEYVRKLHDEQQQLLRQQLHQQLQREEQREEQRMQQVAESRGRQREHLRGQQEASATASPDAGQDQVQQLSEQLEKQHLLDDKVVDTQEEHQHHSPAVVERQPSRPPSTAGPQAPQAHEAADIVEGVVDNVKLDGRRPWNHYRPLQKELDRRRRERAAAASAREAMAARNAEANAQARMEVEYRRYLDWRLRTRRAGRPVELSPRMEAARRWGEARKEASLQQRVDRDGQLAEWRRAKDQQQRERRQAATAAQKAAQEAAAEKQRRAHDSFTRWLDTIHERKLADEKAGPVGATGVTTYEAFHTVPWTKAARGGQRPGLGPGGRHGARKQ